MIPEKETSAEWTARLEELRKAGKRHFGYKLEANRISFDLSVLGHPLKRRAGKEDVKK
jgi:hypothetical protein